MSPDDSEQSGRIDEADVQQDSPAEADAEEPDPGEADPESLAGTDDADS